MARNKERDAAERDYDTAQKQTAQRNEATIRAMFAARPEHERFMALMLATAVPPDATAGILQSLRGGGSPLTRLVPEADNRPLRQFVGKSRAMLERDLGGDKTKIDAVMRELAAAGLEPESMNPRATNAAEESEDRQRRAGRLPTAQPTDIGSPISPLGTVEPTFGTEQLPASEIWHLPDDELAAIDGIGPEQVPEIRRLQAAYDAHMEAAAATYRNTPRGAAGATPAGADETPAEATDDEPEAPSGGTGPTPAGATGGTDVK